MRRRRQTKEDTSNAPKEIEDRKVQIPVQTNCNAVNFGICVSQCDFCLGQFAFKVRQLMFKSRQPVWQPRQTGTDILRKMKALLPEEVFDSVSGKYPVGLVQQDRIVVPSVPPKEFRCGLIAEDKTRLPTQMQQQKQVFQEGQPRIFTQILEKRTSSKKGIGSYEIVQSDEAIEVKRFEICQFRRFRGHLMGRLGSGAPGV